jgi:hypothetical protein
VIEGFDGMGLAPSPSPTADAVMSARGWTGVMLVAGVLAIVFALAVASYVRHGKDIGRGGGDW